MTIATHGAANVTQLRSSSDWSECAHGGHLVQFYEDDAFLINTVTRFIGDALQKEHGAVVIGTQAHRAALEARLASMGYDVSKARRNGQYLDLDAAETLAKFMLDGRPDEQRFSEVVGGVIDRVASRYAPVQMFGEMVALLWADENSEAAIQLEKLWNALAKIKSFSLCCAYPINGFSRHVHGAPFLEVCAEHSHVVPAESYLALTSADERHRTVAELQQKTAALQTEINEHKKTHEALQRREQELSDFLEYAAEGLHRVGPDGKILWANSAELALLGYTADEYIGHHIAEFHADPEVIEDILGKLLRGDTLRDYPARLRCKDGSIRHVLIQSNARWDEGKFIYTRCFTRDVTDRVRLDEMLQSRLKELAETDQRKNEFLAMLGHELRNPLSPILSALEILKMPGADAAAIRTAHDAIGHQTRHLAHIVDDLLDVTRINSGKIHLRDERVELSTVLKRAAEITRPLVDAKRHRLLISLPNSSVLINGDATRLEQIFTNLLTNAAKYMNPNGEVSLAAAIVGNEVTISVADKGVGISTDLLPRIFDLFTQAERSLDRSLGGLGVGLWMVRRLVELHGGNVEAHSKGPGKGSTFVVRLPLANLNAKAAGNESVQAAAGLNTSTSRCRIMVVDDNRDAADMLGILLRMQGHVVQVAHDGFAAVQMAPTFNPDVVLLDIGLPGLDGYAVAKQLRRLQSRTPLCLIAVTGYGQEEDRARSRAAGFDHHIVKPVEPSELSELLLRSQQSAELPHRCRE